MKTAPRIRGTRASRQRGLSLLELMISIAIGLFLLAGLVGIFVNSSQTNAELSKSAQQVENGRYAMQAIADDLSLAGYYGYYAPDPATAIEDPCATDAATLLLALRMPVLGYNAQSSPPSPLSGCLTDANHVAGTDILVIRRADTQETSGSTFQVGRMYLQANANPFDLPILAAATSASGTVGSGNTFPRTRKDGSVAPPRKVHVHIYFVSPCSQPLVCTGASTDDDIPTLKRLELTATGFTVVPLAEGIENLQLDYGVDADGDGAPETPFIANPSSAAAWSNVVAIQVALLARNVEATSGYSDAKTYNLGQFTSYTPSGAAASYKRHAYTGLVRVVNPSARREVP